MGDVVVRLSTAAQAGPASDAVRVAAGGARGAADRVRMAAGRLSVLDRVVSSPFAPRCHTPPRLNCRRRRRRTRRAALSLRRRRSPNRHVGLPSARLASTLSCLLRHPALVLAGWRRPPPASTIPEAHRRNRRHRWNHPARETAVVQSERYRSTLLFQFVHLLQSYLLLRMVVVLVLALCPSNLYRASSIPSDSLLSRIAR